MFDETGFQLQESPYRTLDEVPFTICDVRGAAIAMVVNYPRTSQLHARLGAVTRPVWIDAVGQTTPTSPADAQEALAALVKLKEWQHVIDHGVDACRQAETELRALIKDEIDSRDDRLEGWTRIDEKARSLGDIFKPKLEKAQAEARDMESWKNDATKWNAPDGHGWPEVKTDINEAAEGTYSYNKSMLEKVDVACRQLSWGTQHPEVKKAAAQLKEHASSRDEDYVKLRDRAKKFANDVRAYRTLLAEDDAKIHELVCVNGSTRGDEDMEEAIDEIADR